MDYTDADFWSTSAQLLIVLWLIIAVETKPTTAETAMYRERAEQSKLIKALYQSQAMMILVAGAFSLFTLAVAMLVLSGLISPTLNLTALTMLAIGFTSTGAMTGLVETMIKTSGLLKPSPGGQNPTEEEVG